jgi:hypothetical protein
MSDTSTDNKFTCGRRTSNVMTAVNQDTWREDGTCSYCGSLNPDTFMRRVEDGTVFLGPTDKGYKVYVENNGGEKFKIHYRDCYRHGTKDCNWESCTHWVISETDETKFYFQHLSPEQKTRFIELYNAKKMNISYPGHFYRLPFFMSP